MDTLHSGEYIGDEVDEAEERRARRAVALSFLSNMSASPHTQQDCWHAVVPSKGAISAFQHLDDLMVASCMAHMSICPCKRP